MYVFVYSNYRNYESLIIIAALTSRFIMLFLMILRQINPTHSTPVTLCSGNFGN